MTEENEIKPKLVAYIIKPLEKDWSVVNQTEYYDDGNWLLGMNLITSIGDVMDRAMKKKIAVYPESIFSNQLSQKKEQDEN